MTTDDKYRNLERVNFWVTNCDSKTSYLLTLQGIILTIIITSNFSIYIVDTISLKFSFVNFGWNSIFRFLEGLSLYLSMAFVLISLISVYKTLRARLDPKVFNENGLSTNSVLFFETIANRKYVDFVSDQPNTTSSTTILDNDIDSQIFINSKICQLKFKYYNLALKYCSLGFVSGLIYALLIMKNGS